MGTSAAASLNSIESSNQTGSNGDPAAAPKQHNLVAGDCCRETGAPVLREIIATTDVGW